MASRKPGYPSTSISPFSSEAHDPLWVPVSSTAFPELMMNFKSIAADDRSGNEDDDYKGYGILQTGAKKRRLSAHQVQFLERNFDLENKLEPDRKAHLAKELELEPRQVNIWFQNRRARFKTKMLENEYRDLKDSYDKLKAECDSLIQEKEQLKEEVHFLKEQLKNKGSIKLISSDKVGPVSPGNTSEDRKSNTAFAKELPDQKPTTSASRSSGVLDSDSPYITDSNQPALLIELANSSHAFEPYCSDFYQEEGNNPSIPRLERGIYCPPPTSSCGIGFTTELDQQLWSWPY